MVFLGGKWVGLCNLQSFFYDFLTPFSDVLELSVLPPPSHTQSPLRCRVCHDSLMKLSNSLFWEMGDHPGKQWSAAPYNLRIWLAINCPSFHSSICRIIFKVWSLALLIFESFYYFVSFSPQKYSSCKEYSDFSISKNICISLKFNTFN